MSVVTDKLCPKLNNMQINNQTEDKENMFQLNGILNGRVVRYFIQIFPPLLFLAVSSQERPIGFQRNYFGLCLVLSLSTFSVIY